MAIAIPALPVTGNVIDAAWGIAVRNSISEIDPDGSTEDFILTVNSGTDGYDLVTLGATTAQLGTLVGGGSTALHTHAVAAGLVLEGVNTTEVTTTSTSEADLITVASLTIAVGQYFDTNFCFRKSTGHASAVKLGAKWNASNNMFGATTVTTTNNTAENGICHMVGGPRRGGNYIYDKVMEFAAYSTSGQPSEGRTVGSTTTPPTAEITTVIIRGSVTNASNTLGTDELQVHSRVAS